MLDRKRAYKLILIMGFVSLLSDFTYEGAKGIIGPYLAFLGASAFTVSLISGVAELLGYWVRLVSGFASDRLKTYWSFTLVGYALNLLSVPLLGFAKSWQSAGFLVLLERSGKGLRTPSRDAILSRATQVVGHGKGFGLHEFLDQMGAILGPFVVGLVLLLGFGYRHAFFLLFLPALLALFLLFFAKRAELDRIDEEKPSESDKPLGRDFYLYLLVSCLVALSFLNFPLIAYHLSKELHLNGWQVSFLFALAMGVDALSALFFGFLFDRIAFKSLLIGLSVGMLSPILLFSLNQPLIAIIFWGISLGVQESIMRSGIARLSPQGARGRAYGIFHFFFGLSTFLGGALMGMLYEFSPHLLVVYSVLFHFLAVGLLLRLR